MFASIVAKLDEWRRRYELDKLTVEVSLGVFDRLVITFRCRKYGKQFSFAVSEEVLKSACDIDLYVELTVKSKLAELCEDLEKEMSYQ